MGFIGAQALKQGKVAAIASQPWTGTLNGCGEGKRWGEHCTLYPSKAGTPVVTYIYPGGHQFPADAPPVIVRFFKEHAKP